MKMKIRMWVLTAAAALVLAACGGRDGLSDTIQTAGSSSDSAVSSQADPEAAVRLENKRRYDQYAAQVKRDLKEYQDPWSNEMIVTAGMSSFLSDSPAEGGIEGTFRADELAGYRLVIKEGEEEYYCCYYQFGSYTYFTYRTTAENKDRVPNFMCWETACMIDSRMQSLEYDKKYAFRDSGVERSFVMEGGTLYVLDQEKKECYQSYDESQETLCSWMVYQGEMLSQVRNQGLISAEKVNRELPSGYRLTGDMAYIVGDFNQDAIDDVLALVKRQDSEEAKTELWELTGMQGGSYEAVRLWKDVDWQGNLEFEAAYPRENGFLLKYIWQGGDGTEDTDETEESSFPVYMMEYRYEADRETWYLSNVCLAGEQGIFHANRKQLGMIPVTDGGKMFWPDELAFRDDNLQAYVNDTIRSDLTEIRAILQEMESEGTLSQAQVLSFPAYQNSRVLTVRYEAEALDAQGNPFRKTLYAGIDLYTGKKLEFRDLFSYEELLEVAERSDEDLHVTRQMYERLGDFETALNPDFSSVSLYVSQWGVTAAVDDGGRGAGENGETGEPAETASYVIRRRDLLDFPVTDYWDDMP